MAICLWPQEVLQRYFFKVRKEKKNKLKLLETTTTTTAIAASIQIKVKKIDFLINRWSCKATETTRVRERGKGGYWPSQRQSLNSINTINKSVFFQTNIITMLSGSSGYELNSSVWLLKLHVSIFDVISYFLF